MNKVLICSLLLLSIFTFGCGNSKLIAIETGDDFYKTINSNKVVLMDFYKTGCPPCVILEPVLDQLLSEYDGKVTVAKYRHLNPIFMLTSQKVQDQYKVNLVPTVILFVNGKEKNRWLYETNIDVYRKALKEVGVERDYKPIGFPSPPKISKLSPPITSTKDLPKNDNGCGPQGCPIEPGFESFDKEKSLVKPQPQSKPQSQLKKAGIPQKKAEPLQNKNVEPPLSKKTVAPADINKEHVGTHFKKSEDIDMPEKIAMLVCLVLLVCMIGIKYIGGFKHKRGPAASS